MLRKILIGAVIGSASVVTLFAAGCSSPGTDKPHSLTGDSDINANEYNEQARWTDDKGRYRPDWRHGQAPAGYPKPYPKGL